jgi:hypothetical protein
LPSIEQQIVSIGNNLLTKGSGVQGSLAAVLKQTFADKLLSFSLETLDGQLLSVGSEIDTESDAKNRTIAFPFLSEEHKKDKRFLFSVTDKKWNVLTTFSTGSFQWFTNVILDSTSNASIPIRSGLFKLADYFSIQCKKYLQQFLFTLTEKKDDAFQDANPFFLEKTLLSKITTFSSKVKCVVLLDEYGYIFHSAGMDGAVNDLGSALAALFCRSSIELSRLTLTNCSSINLSDREYTIYLGKIPGTTLLIAISATGKNANVLTRFLYTAALDALSIHLQQSGTIFGIPYSHTDEPLRKRNSWLHPPSLIPKGIFVGKIGASTFHTHDCQLLTTTDASQLQWYKTKSEVLQMGLRSCSVCNP